MLWQMGAARAALFQHKVSRDQSTFVVMRASNVRTMNRIEDNGQECALSQNFVVLEVFSRKSRGLGAVVSSNWVRHALT